MNAPDVSSNSLHGPNRIGPDGERTGRRIVERKFSLDVRLEIRHQRGGFDPHQDAARARLQGVDVFQRGPASRPLEFAKAFIKASPVLRS